MVNTNKMIDIIDLPSSKTEHIDELVRLANEAQDFLKSQKWCKNIKRGQLDRGWGRIIAVFYFIMEPAYPEAPQSIWVIVGDLPPAYIDVDDNPNGACAIDAYVMEMQKWVDNVLQEKPIDDLIPVNVPPKKKYANMLKSRLQLVREEILENLEDELKACV